MAQDSFALSAEDLSRLVFTDDLTGLRNRRFLRHTLQSKVAWNDPAAPPLSLLMLDLDNFKEVNDSQGHLAGDRLLMQISGLLSDHVRDQGTVVRYAGDEFVVLLPGTDRAGAKIVADDLRKAILETDAGQTTSGNPVTISSSIGIATFPGDAGSPEALLEAADLAMYQAKQLGKNQVSDGRELDPARFADRSLVEHFPCSRLIGREEEFKVVHEQMDRCRTGGVGLVVLRGKPGLGKTRLLGEIVKSAGERGCIPLLERCAAEERRFPYATFLNLLRRFTRRFSKESRELRSHLPEDEAAVMVRFLPALDGAPEAEDRPIAEALDGLDSAHRTHLFHGLVRSLVRLSDQSLPVLVLDDAENMDEATLDVLATVARESQGKLLVCLAVRTNEAGRVAYEGVERFLGTISRLPQCRTIEMAPLAPAGVRGMLDHLLPGRPADAELDLLIHRTTGGNPLFVEETIKSLILKRKIHRSAEGWRPDRIGPADLPQSLHEVIRGQIEGLDAISRQTIARAAVIGPNFALDLLQGITGSNQGETLEILDKAKKVRLILPAGPDQDQDTEMRFAAHHLREVTYTNTEPQFRKQVHREIGHFEEKRNSDRLEDKSSYLLYHFELGGDAEKAARYKEMVESVGRAVYSAEELDKAGRRPLEGERETQVAEATVPLPEEAEPSVAAFLRNLPVAVKNLRMYPPGSLLIRGAIEALEKTLREVFLFGSTLTLSVEEDRLHVNTRKCDPATFGAAAAELARSLESRAVASLSFASSVSGADLTAFLGELGRTPEADGYPAGYWAAKLQALGLRTIGVAQQTYLVRPLEQAAADEQTIVGEIVAPAAPLAQDLVPAVRETLRHLTGAIENMVMYPPGSRLIVAAVEQLHHSLQLMLQGAKVVLFTEVDGRMVVNGTETSSPSYGAAPGILLKRLAVRGINTLGIREGVTIDELTRFIAAVVRDDLQLQGHKAWEAYLTREKYAHIVVGDRVYAAAKRGNKPTEVPSPKPPETKVPESARELVDQLRKHLENGAEDPKPAALSGAFLTQVEKLYLADDRAGIEAVLAAVVEAARSARNEVRRRTWSFAALFTERLPPVTGPTLAECLAFPLETALESETDEEAMMRAVLVAGRLLGAFVAHGSYVLANRLLWGVFRRMQVGSGRGVSHAATQAVGAAASLPELATLVEAAGADESGSAAARSAACREFLIALGTQAVLPVLNGIRRIEALSARRALARVLKDLGPHAEREILKEINPFGNPRDLVRLFEVLEIFNVDPTPLAIAGFKHKEEAVKRAAIDLLRRLPRERVPAVLSRAVEDEDPEVLKAATTAIGELRPDGGVAWIRGLLKGAAPKEVKQAACIALGKFEDESVVPLLVEILEGGKFLGLFGRSDDDVRSTAAWALGQFRSPVAKEALHRALKDASPAVRSSAKMGLKG